MMKRLFFRAFALITLLFCVVMGAKGQHFVLFEDEAYREQVQRDFEARQQMVNQRYHALFSVFDEQKLTVEETQALQFLYAYMPLSDLADYDGEFFLKQVRLSLSARQYFPWGKEIPEDIFCHYVLAYRVNNENLDNAREVFLTELMPRLKGLSMYEAALEVNHWCHEKVAYRPSDARTSSPLATVRTALGRCGEESTFTVTAMRAVGIPARQCYTPRWAHTDDNHAWVEVWVDGQWYFLGACEPDPELNMGWFAVPSTRTMMVHSNCFGKYNGNEEVTSQTDLYSRVNMLPNYTETRKITITVKDANGHPVQDATVKFKLYNYAEYYPIAVQNTNAAGQASITTGLGDLLIWASKGDQYGYQKLDVRLADQLTVVLDRQPGQEYVEELTIVPPVGKQNVVTASTEKVAENARRLHYEDSVRNAYISTFQTEKDAATIRNENLTQEQIGSILKKSEGNYAEVTKLMNLNAEKKEGLFLYEFINSLSDKDLRDLNADVIQQHLTLYSPSEEAKYPFDVYVKGIISPRISNEGIRPWRKTLKKNMRSELKELVTASAIQQWIVDHIQIDNNGNYYGCPISPMGVYELRRADKHSRDIFFVACCRALDIPAYIDNATGQIYVYEHEHYTVGNLGEEGNGELGRAGWREFDFDEGKKTSKAYGSLTVDYHSVGEEKKPVYWTHYTLARFENGDFVTFDFENDPRVEQFPFTLEQLEEGYYMLSTGNRYSDGTTLSRLEFFNIKPSQNVKKNLIIRELVTRNAEYGKIDMRYKVPVGKKKRSVQQLMKGKQTLLCFIDPTREPTKHLLKELSERKEDFEKWNGTILFVVPSDKRAPDFNFSSWHLPSQSILLEDIDNQWYKNICATTGQVVSDAYPMVYLINPDGTIVFEHKGYNIGTAGLLLVEYCR